MCTLPSSDAEAISGYLLCTVMGGMRTEQQEMATKRTIALLDSWCAVSSDAMKSSLSSNQPPGHDCTVITVISAFL